MQGKYLTRDMNLGTIGVCERLVLGFYSRLACSKKIVELD